MQRPYLGPDLLGGGSVGHDIRVKDMGDDTPHWEGFGRIPPQGGTQADREATWEREGWCMGTHPAG